MQIERPPEIWEADANEARVSALLEAMVAAATAFGAPTESLTLNISNVVMEPPDDGEEMEVPRPGEYVALTILATADLGPDATWHPGAAEATGLLSRIRDWLGAAGVHFAYVRRIPPMGSITVFLRRRQEPNGEDRD